MRGGSSPVCAGTGAHIAREAPRAERPRASARTRCQPPEVQLLSAGCHVPVCQLARRALYMTVAPLADGVLAAYAPMDSARVTAQPPSCHRMPAICWLVRMITGNSGGIAL